MIEVIQSKNLLLNRVEKVECSVRRTCKGTLN